MKDIATIISSLGQGMDVTDAELSLLLRDNGRDAELFRLANLARKKTFGKAVYLRGLLEISNHCARGCYYCGIRSASSVTRYRMTQPEILRCCAAAHKLGFRTFVLQAGEDPALTDDVVCALVAAVKKAHPDSAITLSLGERGKKSYQAFFAAGAERYLLRHESADAGHYARLHPAGMSLARRKACLFTLKELGFQVGAGFMVGAPWQTTRHLVADIRFLQDLQPEMIGMGPFIAHHGTSFCGRPNGGLRLTLRVLALLRLLFPEALIPVTTALASLAPEGRILGLKAGGNVLMPNISPPENRKFYDLYDNKRSAGSESAEGLRELARQVAAAGYAITIGRGDAPAQRSAHEQHSLA